MPSAPGTFCLSIDLELAWGNWDRLTPEDLKNCRELERPVAARVLELFDRHDIPATWAIVGRLLEKPAANESRPGDESAWYAPDIIEKILAAKTPQEIGSHGFAHIYYAECGAEAARADVAAAKSVHAKHGLPFSSFVFPRNQVAHLDLLAAAGIRVYRSLDRCWAEDVRRVNRTAGRAANLLDKIVSLPPRTVATEARRDGMIDLPSSMLFFRRNGLRRLITDGNLEAKIRAGLRRAVERKEIFHLWFHPDTFFYRTDAQFKVLDSILSHASELRRRGELRIIPMAGFAGSA